MKTLQINEGNQTIVAACDLDTYVAPNQFIADLIEAAKVSGKATAKDDEGCEVTAIIS
jgi:hypothetical protein